MWAPEDPTGRWNVDQIERRELLRRAAKALQAGVIDQDKFDKLSRRHEGKAAPVRPKGATITDEDRQYWFFRPLAQPTVPTVKSPALKARINNPIDAFLLAKLEEAGLSYAPPAQKLTLIRRATFDLHGLPPTQAEIDAFINEVEAQTGKSIAPDDAAILISLARAL